MASQTRIKKELEAQNLEVSEQAINAVMEILASGKTVSIVDAVKVYAANQQNTQKLPDTDQLLLGLGVHLSNQQINFITNTALTITVNRIMNGNYGELTPETKQKLEECKQQLQQVKVIDVNFINTALPQSSPNLLPSSEEIFDNAVIGNITQ